MLSAPGGNGSGNDAPSGERLPSYLLSSAPAAARSPVSQFPFTPSSRTPSRDFTSRSAGKPPAGDSTTTSPWAFQSRRQGQAVAFNDRLRTPDAPVASPADASGSRGMSGGMLMSMKGGRGAGVGADASPGSAMRTPSRMPPNKSLLDTGPPSVLSLRSPSSAPAQQASVTPGPLAHRTPGSASPGVPGLERWVTVFGFAPAMESQVLREFRRHGEIVRTVAGKGNWVHILYRTPLQAQVALYRPWRILAGSETMVGTVQCTEPHVAREQDESIEKGILVASPAAATPQGSMTPMRSPSQPHSALRTPASLLRRDHGLPSGGAQSIVRTPQKQTGILDYISGFYK